MTIAAGDTTGAISVRVFDDDVVEPDETFTVALRSPANATIADGKATGTIRDDDEVKPTVSIEDVAVEEGAGSAVFEVTLSAPSARDVTLGYATSNGTARAGQDYTATSGTLTDCGWRYDGSDFGSGVR